MSICLSDTGFVLFSFFNISAVFLYFVFFLAPSVCLPLHVSILCKVLVISFSLGTWGTKVVKSLLN